MGKNRAKLFIENFLAYGLINVLNRIVPLLMLPIVTRLLTDTAEFGRFDMYNTIISFGSSFAILGMYDAMFREYFEKDDLDYKKRVTSTAHTIVFVASSLVIIILTLLNRTFSEIFFGSNQYGYIVILAAIGVFLSANKDIIAAPTRMQNKRKVYVFSGFLNSIMYYFLAIGLIFFGFGYKGMIYANLISLLAILFFFLILNRRHFHFKLYDKKIAKELFKIGIPVLPTFLIYWIFNSMDKIMITNMLGFSQTGIYSIGARVASVSQFIYTAFAGGWQFFAFSTMKDKDQVELTSRVFEYLGIISCIAFLVSTLFDDYVFNLLFTHDYSRGVSVFPYLFLSPLLLMLFQVAGNQFLVIKKSFLITLSLVIGSVVNVILNYVLINSYGIKGAALATLIGFIVSTLIIVLVAMKERLIHIRYRFVLTWFFILIMIIKVFWFDNLYSNIFAVIGIILIFVLYLNDLKSLKKVLFKKKE